MFSHLNIVDDIKSGFSKQAFDLYGKTLNIDQMQKGINWSLDCKDLFELFNITNWTVLSKLLTLRKLLWKYTINLEEYVDSTLQLFLVIKIIIRELFFKKCANRYCKEFTPLKIENTIVLLLITVTLHIIFYLFPQQ